MERAYLEDLGRAAADVDARGSMPLPSTISGEFDRQVFHLDEASAQTTFFGKMVAADGTRPR